MRSMLWNMLKGYTFPGTKEQRERTVRNTGTLKLLNVPAAFCDVNDTTVVVAEPTFAAVQPGPEVRTLVDLRKFIQSAYPDGGTFIPIRVFPALTVKRVAQQATALP